MTKESGRKCSHCGINGHNSRTCNEKVVHNHQHVKLFGVRILNTGGDESVKKSMSMGNLHACNTTNGDHQNSNSDHGYLSDGGLFIRSGRSEAVHHERRRGVPWTEEEHKTFLAGLEKLGKGDWRGISRNFVTTRTPTQVASHAQKYFLRQATPNKKGRRSSLFDVSLEDPPAALHSPINPSDSIPTEQPTTAAATTTSTAAAENSSEAPPATPMATPSLTCSQVPTSSYHGITPPPYMVGISGGGRLGYTAQSSPSPSNFTFPAVSLVPVMNFPINHGYYCVPNQMRSYIPSNSTYGLPVAPPPHSQIAPSSYQHCYRPQVASSSSTSLSLTPLPSSVASTPLLNDQSVNTDLALSIAPPRPQDRAKLLSQTSNLGGAISVL